MPNLNWDTMNGTATTLTYNVGNLSTNAVWYEWTSGTANTNVVWPLWVTGTETYVGVPTPVAAQAPEVQDRAKKILDAHLSEEQRAQLARDRFFVVRGSAGKQYRIKHGRSGNVELLDAQGRVVERLCAHPAIYCPDEDTMLAQKLALEADEAAFYRVANKTRVAA